MQQLLLYNSYYYTAIIAINAAVNVTTALIIRCRYRYC